jgi:hypothetical protein
MTENEHPAIQYFDKAAEFWNSDEHIHLSEIGDANIRRVLEYAKTSEGRVAVAHRGRELDAAIANFNNVRQTRTFEEPFEKESKILAESILTPDEQLPKLADMPQESGDTPPFFKGFARLIHHKYYTFVDKKKLESSEELNSLITGLLVDGYGFALRAKRAHEKQPSIPKSDLTIVNAICEMVPPGELQTEMYKANWYKPDYGLTPEFCTHIASQQAKL